MKNTKKMVLMSGLALSLLAGCGKKDNVLEDTILEETVVGTVDGDVAILRYHHSDYGTGRAEKRNTEEHAHYYDIVNGEYITDFKSCTNISVRTVKEITVEGSIYTYLTEEELLKAMNSELTDEDIVAIIKRIQNSLEEEKSLVKKID